MNLKFKKPSKETQLAMSEVAGGKNLDIDYQTAKTIALTLIQHNAKVFSTLPSTPQPIMAKGGQRGRLKQVFLERLPAEFDRKTYAQLAEEVGLNAKSIDRTIRKWCDGGILENIIHGRYKKIINP